MKFQFSASVFALAFVSLGACASSSLEAMRTISDSPVGEGATQQSVGRAVRTSLISRLWTIESETENSIVASIVSEGSQQMAKIKVVYDADSFSIERLATRNFDYQENSGMIAARYNRWITNIEHDVMVRTGVPVEDANAHVYRAREETAAASQ